MSRTALTDRLFNTAEPAACPRKLRTLGRLQLTSIRLG
jgi:hypothetical protein